MAKYKTEFSAFFKEAKMKKLSRVPKNKIRRLAYYLRNITGYKLAKTKKGEAFLIYI